MDSFSIYEGFILGILIALAIIAYWRTTQMLKKLQKILDKLENTE